MEIKRLKSTIKGVENLSEDRNRKVKSDAQTQQRHDQQTHESRMNKLKEDVALLKKKLQEKIAEHREKEQALRKV